MNRLEFGWYIPTNGDTTAFNAPDKQRPPSLELFERIIHSAEAAGFEYILLPVIPACWEAYMSGAFLAARTRSIKSLLAARPGYINPVLLAKMLTTFDQLTGGRLCINLIAGVSDREIRWWAGIIAAPHSGFVRAIIWIILANIRAGFICLRVLNLSVVIIPTHYQRFGPMASLILRKIATP
ncbi:hypothetical protein C2W62_07205 [Candidatus Entotheonella serta]|nr:hypothetical protein C2W62_07205 [Candidatus Entotheonella serta]